VATPRTYSEYHNYARTVNNHAPGNVGGEKTPQNSAEPPDPGEEIGRTWPKEADLYRVLALASFSAEGSWRVIESANTGGRVVNFEVALQLARSGTAVAGRVRPDVVALDLDCASELDELSDEALDEAGKRIVAGDELMDSGVAGKLSDDPSAQAARQRLTLYRIARRLLESGATPVIVRSGRIGNRHLLARLNEGPLRSEIVNAARAAGIDVRHGNSLLRPPGWPHRQGLAVSVASVGARSFDGVEGSVPGAWWLAAGASQAHEIASGPSTKRSEARRDGRLPEALWQLIRFGDVDGRYSRSGQTDRSALTLAICNMAVAAGVHDRHLWNLLCDVRNVGGAGLRARMTSRGESGRSGAWSWFAGVYAKAQDSTTRGPWKPRDEYVAGRLSEISTVAASVTMAGASGASDRVVLAACLRAAERWNSLVLPLSVRAVSCEAGVSSTTAQRALKRLRAAGWLQLCRTSRKEKSAVYRLTLPPGYRTSESAELVIELTTDLAATTNDPTSNNSTLSRPFLDLGPDAQQCTSSIPTGGCRTVPLLRESEETALFQRMLALASHDAFHRLALGKGCLETWARIPSAGATATALAGRSGKHPATIRRHLASLQQAGLVEKQGQCWYRVDVASLEECLEDVASERGTLGLSAKRQARYAAERAAYGQYLLAIVEAMAGQRLFADQGQRGWYRAPQSSNLHRGPPVAA